jgi:hypothetical protein
VVPEARSNRRRTGRHLQGRDDWGAGAYTVDEAAIRHGAGVEKETNDAGEAYARFPGLEPMPYRDGSLPGNS